jgi:hypothetical protein
MALSTNIPFKSASRGKKKSPGDRLIHFFEKNKTVVLVPGSLKEEVKKKDLPKPPGAHGVIEFGNLDEFYDVLKRAKNYKSIYPKNGSQILVASRKNLTPLSDFEIGNDIEKIRALLHIFQTRLQGMPNTHGELPPRLFYFEQSPQKNNKPVEAMNGEMVYTSTPIILAIKDGATLRLAFKLSTRNDYLIDDLKKNGGVIVVAKPSISSDEIRHAIDNLEEGQDGLIRMYIHASRHTYWKNERKPENSLPFALTK